MGLVDHCARNWQVRGIQVFSASRSECSPDDTDGITQISVDFSSSEQSSSFAEKFIDQYGVPDLLVNNAGYGAFYEWGGFPETEITKQIEVLFSAPRSIVQSLCSSDAKRG